MKLRHYDKEGHARFVTFATHRRIPLLTNNLFRLAIIGSLANSRTKHHLRILAYVIMPEHVHIVVVPPADSELGEIVGEIKNQSAHLILAHLRKTKSSLLEKLTVLRDGRKRRVLWQRRCFDHNCRNDDELQKCIEYCHNNPVKVGLIKSAENWEWSSCQFYLGNKNARLTIDI